MASQLVIFLDDGGVMNDNSQRASQWQRLVGEYFMPLLGGTSEAWIEANRIVTSDLFDTENWQKRINAASNYASFDHVYQFDWLRGMCAYLGIQPPPQEECVKLARRAIDYITPRVHAAFPGAVDAIRMLQKQGHTLHTASGTSSIDLAAILEGMGVRDCFSRLYGPDLVDTFKAGPEYYERIFADAGISTANALVVDDSPQAINWAAQVGAKAVLIGDFPHFETRAMLHIRRLATLPEIIEQLG